MCAHTRCCCANPTRGTPPPPASASRRVIGLHERAGTAAPDSQGSHCVAPPGLSRLGLVAEGDCTLEVSYTRHDASTHSRPYINSIARSTDATTIFTIRGRRHPRRTCGKRVSRICIPRPHACGISGVTVLKWKGNYRMPGLATHRHSVLHRSAFPPFFCASGSACSAWAPQAHPSPQKDNTRAECIMCMACMHTPNRMQ